jgi:integrase
MRDFAIARCLADLALRRMEVVRLQLGSFDWQNGIVTLTDNKCGREGKLPLPMQTGEALVRYLQYGRPDTSMLPSACTIVMFNASASFNANTFKQYHPAGLATRPRQQAF